ncbi:FxsA family protein [Pseudahrensia aquimaris]|uniref:FxsA family protein n=1 Tax=Pseudahrensia aquimaris TaxID=744461 RepID=A0ABW3FEU2_9HYPH
MPFALIPFMLLVVPIVEIAAFIAIGQQIGIGLTLLMILVTAIIGTFLLRSQGFAILETIKTETNAGRVPGRALGDGAMILVAGILLLTPGFVTDTLGFLLFVPGVRGAIWKFLSSRITVVTPMDAAFRDREPSSPYASDDVIDLDDNEYHVQDRDPNSPWKKD